MRGFLAAVLGRIFKTSYLVQVTRPEIRTPLYVRVPSTDVETFNQVFFHKEYAFDVKREPRTIVDAGANCGLASVYLANHFPEARIIDVEPDESNLRVLCKNIAPYPKIESVEGAVWYKNEPLALVDPGLGNWGFMTEPGGEGSHLHGAFVRRVPGLTIDAIMDRFGIEHIDILKMDIEGAEREVFGNAEAWIDKVDALIVELHERLKPGCSRNFYRGTRGFDVEWQAGENVYLTRKTSSLVQTHT